MLWAEAKRADNRLLQSSLMATPGGISKEQLLLTGRIVKRKKETQWQNSKCYEMFMFGKRPTMLSSRVSWPFLKMYMHAACSFEPTLNG
jgi:hypothetical protein